MQQDSSKTCFAVKHPSSVSRPLWMVFGLVSEAVVSGMWPFLSAVSADPLQCTPPHTWSQELGKKADVTAYTFERHSWSLTESNLRWCLGGTRRTATRRTTEYLSWTSGYRTGRRFVHSQTNPQKAVQRSEPDAFFFSPSTCRNVITCGGTLSPQSSLKTTPCWPSPSVWKMDPNVTVRNSEALNVNQREKLRLLVCLS